MSLIEQAIEDAIEQAYWQFDARRKGDAEWKQHPQSERDAFKAEARGLVKGYFPTPRCAQITAEDRERAEGVCNRLLAFMTWLPEEDSVVDSDLREAAALLRKAYL